LYIFPVFITHFVQVRSHLTPICS